MEPFNSDDEAFIRMIVANPADDAPRLIYADWLEEREDPRGAYLRAEAEWVKVSMRGGRGKIIRKAKGLDPVWVARVSRPPAGVCCEHLALSSTGAGVQLSDFDDVESELSVKFPPELRALLMNYRLGHLRGGPFVFYRTKGARGVPVGSFVCSLDADWTEDTVSYELIDRTEWLREDYGLNPKLVFLASTFDDGEFVVSCRRSDNGSVHEAHLFQMEDEPPGSGVERIAGSIGEFLAMLQPRTWPLTDI